MLCVSAIFVLPQMRTVLNHVPIQIASSVRQGTDKSDDPNLNDGNRNATVNFAVKFMLENGMTLMKRKPIFCILQNLTKWPRCELRENRQNGKSSQIRTTLRAERTEALLNHHTLTNSRQVRSK